MEWLTLALKRARFRIKWWIRPGLGALASATLHGLRWFDLDSAAELSGRLMRMIGPWLSEHRVGRANLRAAFPEKSKAEIDAILLNVWQDLGRFAIEFANLDRVWRHDPKQLLAGRVEFDAASEQRYLRLRDDGKGALVFAAHLGNWELPALAGPAYGLESAVVYRRPNLEAVARAVEQIRAVNMGAIVGTDVNAPLKLARMLESGVHVGMLVDQFHHRGVDVTFFGRVTKCNPLLARLARQVECPIYGVRVIRLPQHRFRLELSDALEPPRDHAGAIDVQGTMQAITKVIEDWIREYPDQWLWMHRRWR